MVNKPLIRMPLMDPQICFRCRCAKVVCVPQQDFCTLPVVTNGYVYNVTEQGTATWVFLEVFFPPCSENWGIVPIYTSKKKDLIQKLGRMLKERLMFLQRCNFKWGKASTSSLHPAFNHPKWLERLLLMGISKKVPLVYQTYVHIYICTYIYLYMHKCVFTNVFLHI